MTNALGPLERWKRNNARAKLQSALIKGRLVREPCLICGDPVTDGHHADYDEPLSVVWLCSAHHWQTHKECRVIEMPNYSAKKVNGRWVVDFAQKSNDQ